MSNYSNNHHHHHPRRRHVAMHYPAFPTTLSGSGPRGGTNHVASPGIRLAADIGLATIAYAAEQIHGTKKPEKPKGSSKSKIKVKEEASSDNYDKSSPSPNQFEDAPEESKDNDSLPQEKESPPPPPAKKQKTTDSNDKNKEKDNENGGEVITTVLEHDVLFGRGGSTNRHAGNIEYRNLVKREQLRYLEAHRLCKGEIARLIVKEVRDRGGRFLKREGDTYVDVGDIKARDKTSQALREGLSQRLFSQTQKEGQISLTLLDDGSRDAISKLFSLGPKKRKTPASHERKPIHPINVDDESAIIPTDADIVYGKGKAIQDHPGNIRFRNIVNMHRQSYQSALRKADKSRISNDICRIVKTSGGRFLEFEDGKYHEVQKDRAKEKVSHALRNRKHYANTILREDRSASSTPPPPFPRFEPPRFEPTRCESSSYEAV